MIEIESNIELKISESSHVVWKLCGLCHVERPARQLQQKKEVWQNIYLASQH